jgi:hypothetical protein
MHGLLYLGEQLVQFFCLIVGQTFAAWAGCRRSGFALAQLGLIGVFATAKPAILGPQIAHIIMQVTMHAALNRIGSVTGISFFVAARPAPAACASVGCSSPP